ncbi:MAG: spermidine synthase [Candidatus Methylomirabilales bacterium]
MTDRRRDGAAKGNAGEAAAPRLQVEHYEGHAALCADGVVHSVALGPGEGAFGYWAAMLPAGFPARALLLGVGGGTLAHLLVRRNPAVRLLGVDNDPEVVAFAQQHFGLQLPNLEVVIADAFAFVDACRERFDYVAVDLFTGHTFHRGVLARPFLRRLRELLAPGGEIAINMFRDRRAEVRLGRIRRVLPVQQVQRLPRNVVVHSRPDAPPVNAS